MVHQAFRARTDGPNIPSAIYARPPGYPNLEVDMEIKLRRSINRGWKRYRISARDPTFPVNKYSTSDPAHTNFLVTTGGSKISLMSLDNYFETTWDDEPKGKKQLMSTLIGICADQQLGLVLRQPGSNQIGGVKKKLDDDVVITPEMSPIQQPNFWVWSAGKDDLPVFDLTNGTGYTPLYYFLVLYGDIYQLEEIPASSKYAYPVDLAHVMTG